MKVTLKDICKKFEKLITQQTDYFVQLTINGRKFHVHVDSNLCYLQKHKNLKLIQSLDELERYIQNPQIIKKIEVKKIIPRVTDVRLLVDSNKNEGVYVDASLKYKRFSVIKKNSEGIDCSIRKSGLKDINEMELEAVIFAAKKYPDEVICCDNANAVLMAAELGIKAKWVSRTRNKDADFLTRIRV